ncbi:MAG: glycosyltransferase family 39 protein [Thermoflavifilum sp.]|nr:glycosyltransferase family 39 protein [Thermoflavifilum sp.]MCL6515022.1 glycosyltransferase family 39 protein [Alicyclobacillus sp.]
MRGAGLPIKRLYGSPLTWIVVGNLVLRFLWLSYMHPPQVSDFAWYFTHAVQLARGEGYVWNGHPTAYWPIGWPFFLSLFIRVFGPHVMLGMFLNAILSTGIVVLVYMMAWEVFQSRAAATVAAVAYSLLPSQILWNSVLGSEELFTFLLTLSLYLYMRAAGRSNRWAPWVLLSGVCLGLACDVRAIAYLFPVVLALYEWVVERRAFLAGLQRTVLHGLAMLVAIAPVTIRNMIALKHFVLVSTNGGVNLWQGTKIDGGYFWSYDPAVNPLLAGNDEVTRDQIGKRVFLQNLEDHPLRILHHGLIKIVDLYKNDTNSVWYTFHMVRDALALPAARFCTATYHVFMILALGGMVYMLSRKAVMAFRRAAVPVAWILYNTLLFLFFPAWDRFRYPMMPLFALFIGALAWLAASLGRSRPHSTPAAHRDG